MPKQRLEYIDLAKGIGILFIVAMHIGALPVWMPRLSASWVPLFFILSGFFFKPSISFKSLVIKKANTILIPFLFFYIGAYILFYIFGIFTPSIIKTDAKGILDLFYQEGYFNGPIWFLLSLFWDFILLWLIFKATSSNGCRILIISAICAVGIYFGTAHIFIPLKIAQAFTALPFFYLGYITKSSDWLDTVNRPYSVLFAILLFAIGFAFSKIFAPIYHEPSTNSFTGNVIISFVIILCISFSIIFFSKAVNHVIFVNYFGRYSLIPLCLHHLIYRPILLVFNKLPPPQISDSRIGVTIVTVIVIAIFIPLFIKYFPCFCGQKNLIKQK